MVTSNGGNSRASKRREKELNKQRRREQQNLVRHDAKVFNVVSSNSGSEMKEIRLEGPRKVIPLAGDCQTRTNAKQENDVSSKNDGDVMSTALDSSGKKRRLHDNEEAAELKRRRVHNSEKNNQDEEPMGDIDNDDGRAATACAETCLKSIKTLRKFPSKEDQIVLPHDCNSLLDLMRDPIPEFLRESTVQQRASCILNFLLQPSNINAIEFYEEYWEQKPLLVQKKASKHRHRFDGLLSEKEIHSMLSLHTMCYGRDLNVTRYEPDKHGVKRRVNLDLVYSKKASGDAITDYVKVDPEIVWDHYKQGCTVRLLCPHKYSDPVHLLLHMLELEWGCMTGANAYLTPPGASQGFAPHYDDIEAFCLQLEGRKRWKVYAPLTRGETLPRQSSPDYTEKDLEDVKPVMDVVLSPGDMLYMPRGWIHCACTLPDGQGKEGHSLHLTVSAMQQWSWADLMEIVLPEALNAAAASETSTALRQGLPIRFLDYMGAAHSSKIPDTIKRKADEDASVDSQDIWSQQLQEQFRSEAKMRIMRVAKEAVELIDAACDQISKQFLSARQPPCLTKQEIARTNAGINSKTKIMPNMLVRLVRPGVARLVLEDEKVVLYHCLENTREYHGRPIVPLEFELDDGAALEQLVKTTEPQWLCVQDLFHDSTEEKVGVTQALFDEGLLIIRG